MKYKKIIIIIFLIILLYFYLLFNINKIQTISTFPWIYLNVQDLVWYKKTQLNFEEINIKDDFWNNINWLYLTWSKNEVVYYFHWNWWPLSYFYSEIKYINDLWYSVFAYDYPWYWKSTWFPDKKIVDNFSKKFFERIKTEKNIKNENLIIWWYSVWTAVATDFASKNDFLKIILVAPFSSRYDMWSRYFFWIPLQKLFFLQNSYKTSDLVKQVKKPILIIHWNADMIVPFWQWKKVFENCIWEKYFIEIDKKGHNWIIDDFGYLFKNIFISFISWEKLDFQYLIINDNTKKELEEKNKQLEEKKINLELYQVPNDFLNFLDFKKDDSITKYVSQHISFLDLKYKPIDLVDISWDFVLDAKWNQKLREIAKINLDKLSKDFYLEFWNKLKIVSAWRSYEYQIWIKNSWCNNLFCAKPWHSEHQTWLAFDIFETTNKDEFLSKPNLKKYFEWLEQNAYKYWFINTYQKGRKVDWYEIEPWHWRYIWQDFAKYLFENNLTFWEFFKER